MSEGALVLGADVGTTGCRACVLGPDGRLCARASVSYQPDRPMKTWAQQDPMVWWRAFCECALSLSQTADLGALRAVALSGQSTALVPLDADGEPVRQAIIWQDRRCVAQCRQLCEKFGAERIRAVTGMRPDTFLVWPKVLWFQEREPALFARTRWIVGAVGYVVFRLCGELLLDCANAVGYPLRLGDLSWHEEFCRRSGFPTGLVPPIVLSTRCVGELSGTAASECGLPEGTSVVAGGMDTACAALAVGVFKEGRTFEVTGTSGGIGVCSAVPATHQALGVTPHVCEGLYLNHAPMSAGGASLTWFKDRFCHPEAESARRRGLEVYHVMEEEASALGRDPTGLIFLPYLAGERAPVWDPAARGAICGLTLQTSRAQLIKMIMEGVAFGLRQNVEVAEEGGLRVDGLRSCGGGSKSALWCQIKADVTGKRVVAYPPERDAAFGAALLAGLGVGVWSLHEVDAIVERADARQYLPSRDVTEKYTPLFRKYCKLYASVKHLFTGP